MHIASDMGHVCDTTCIRRETVHSYQLSSAGKAGQITPTTKRPHPFGITYSATMTGTQSLFSGIVK